MPDSSGSPRWLLFIHQLPPKPDYLRVKVRRRLQRLGAVPLKHTVYVLPAGDEALEDFTWLAREIEGEGGSAVICEATFVDGATDRKIETMLKGNPARTWVTREDVHVDRIASAWLIRRFIDPRADFKFVPGRGYAPRPGEVRFDMFQAEYTHEGEHCTFETLLARFNLRDRALNALGEIVHDIDLKDDRFGRPETDGVASLVRGIVQNHAGDTERIDRGAALFDDLYASMKRGRPKPRGE
jgi:hypothetical protein